MQNPDLPMFRKIRERLMERFSREQFRPGSQRPIGMGAAGDKTFPVDRIAEDIVLSELETSGLPFSVVSEEYGVKELNGGGRKVLVDPIDGSKNAVSGIPFYCTSIAVADGETIGSVSTAYVVNLINGGEFFAWKGHGAFLNNEQIYSQQTDELSLVAYEAQVPGRDTPRVIQLLSRAHKARCLGATALDLAYLAYGSISVFVCPAPSRSFDFAGGWLLVRESGGVFTDLEGNPLDMVGLGLGKSVPLLAAGNRRLHEKALRLLHE